MYKKENRYEQIYFTVILFVLSFVGFLVVKKYYVWTSYFGISISALIFFLVFIPLAKYAANVLRKFIEFRDLHRKRAFKVFLASMILFPVALVSLTFYIEYKEKSLIQVASFDPEDVDYLEINIGWDYKNTGDYVEDAKKLHDFLSQYKVKKMRYSEWDNDVSKEKGFVFTVETNNNRLSASVYENRMIIYSDGGYYSVTNGPIDMEWIYDFVERED